MLYEATLILCFSLFWIYLYLPSWFISCLEWMYPDVLFRHPTKQKVVALSIDDGPNSVSTRKLINFLNYHNVSATWFMIGLHVEVEDPNYTLLREMVEAGHEIGNHTLYDKASIRLKQKDLYFQIDILDRIISTVYYTRKKPKTKLFRPGSGFFTRAMINTAKQLKYRTVLGSNYPHDGERLIRSFLGFFFHLPKLYAWFILHKLQPGDIIILHDLLTTIDTLQIILPELKKRGYQVVTIDQLLKTK